jgi:hypothetical protein
MGLAWAKGSSLNYGHVVVAVDRIKATPPCLFFVSFYFFCFPGWDDDGLTHKHVETWNKNKNQ